MPEQPSTRKAELVDPELYSQYQDCDRWAVIVGVSKYQYPNLNLRYADRDAEALYQLLLTPNGGDFQLDHICKLTNEQATTGNITRALRSFLKKPAREDLVLIYFACHGSPDPDRPSNVYLLTYDTDPNDIAGTALPMDDIDRALKGILNSEKVIILADTCHSAAIGGGIGGRRSVVDDSKLMNRFLQEISRSKGGVALLSSAEANEVSFEDAKWGGGHGVFTHYLLEGMRGAADHDGNGIVTIGELFEYVRDNVKQATGYKQHPSIGTNAYDRNLPVALTSNLVSLATSGVSKQPQHTPSIVSHLKELEKPEPQSLQPIDDLSSEKGVDYTQLRDLLKAEKWKEADEETRELMCEVMGRRQGKQLMGQDLTLVDIEKFPITDLRTIDQLWVNYSDGKFGFSVQKKIWQKLSNRKKSFDAFGETVGWKDSSGRGGIFMGDGWRKYSDQTFDKTAPPGHLPMVFYQIRSNWGGYEGDSEWKAIFSRPDL